MDTTWIQVFVLTFAECVAPAGKSVCQTQEFELQFANRDDCEYALQHLIDVKDALDYVIVDRRKSRCTPSAASTQGFVSADAINAAHENTPGWKTADETVARRKVVSAAHQDRLENLKSCDDTGGEAPCKIGEIIVEPANGESVEVWRRDNP